MSADAVHLEAGPATLQVHALRAVPYGEAFDHQRRLQAEVIAGRERGDRGMHVLLVEHDPPVITVSRRRGARDHLIATEEQLARSGVTVAETDRGGDITYHGPGQLVVYPIIDLNVFGLRLHGYMRRLEQTVIDTLAAFGVDGERDADATGVWLHRERPDGGAKIAAMGVRVSRWVTMHGLALNVAPNLGHFDLIVPCGLAGRPVTSLQRELGEAAPAIDVVADHLVRSFARGLAFDAADGEGSFREVRAEEHS